MYYMYMASVADLHQGVHSLWQIRGWQGVNLGQFSGTPRASIKVARDPYESFRILLSGGIDGIIASKALHRLQEQKAP